MANHAAIAARSFKRRSLDRAVASVVAGVKTLFGPRRSAAILAHVAESIVPIVVVETPRGALSFYCPGEVPLFRANTLLTKEPETIEWIDTFQDGDVLWDIGANVGVYSLYASLTPGVRVLAFEPAVANCHALNRNIEINGLDARLSAFCVAFSEFTSLDSLYMGGTRIGEASHAFGEELDHRGQPFRAQFQQGAVGFSIDDFVVACRPPFPSHIKIDVDGIEDGIIRGAKNTLADARLKSMLVELDVARTDYSRAVIASLERAGLRLLHRKHSPMFDGTEYDSIYNHVFVRAS